MKQAQEKIFDKRTGFDRRNWTCKFDFPYVDGHGYLVEDERRKNTDRRNSRKTPRRKL